MSNRFFQMSLSGLILTLLIIEGLWLVPHSQAQTDAEELLELEKRMDELKQEIDQHRGNIAEKRKEKRSLQRDISLLNSEISQTKLSIEQTALSIKRLQWQIEKKQQDIKELEKSIKNKKQLLADHLRVLNYNDQDSLLEILLKGESLSEVFQTFKALDILQKEIQISLEDIRKNRQQIKKEQKELAAKEEDQVATKKFQESQKRVLQRKRGQKDYLLEKTKGQEEKYQDMLKESQVELQQVVTRIELLQSGGESLTPEDALRLARYSSTLTGVRPAFLIAILQQESNFNRYTGSCHYEVALRSSHNYEEKIFEGICQSLGLDPDERLVSCPFKNSAGDYIGSGGAMGAAQFIPATWESVKSKVTNLVGHTPNPWAVKDALVAMGVLLARNGADAQTYNAEHRAACAYFGRCSFGGVDYAAEVIDKANYWQKWIDQQ